MHVAGYRLNLLLVIVRLPLLFAPVDALGSTPYGDAVLRIDFQDYASGPLTAAQLSQHITPVYSVNIGARTRIVVGPDGNKALAVAYPRGGVGPSKSGALFLVGVPPSQEYYLSYRLLVEKQFDFRNGGKLPGLSSRGCKFSGGRLPRNGEGWSARLVWGRTGDVGVYLYHAGMNGPWGDHIAIRGSLERRRWHTIVERVRLNTDGEANGILQVWLDGRIGLDRRDVKFRMGKQAPVEALCFSTFHGGSSDAYAPQTTGQLLFDDVVISSGPPGT